MSRRAILRNKHNQWICNPCLSTLLPRLDPIIILRLNPMLNAHFPETVIDVDTEAAGIVAVFVKKALVAQGAGVVDIIPPKHI